MKFSPELENYRVRRGEYATSTGDAFGMFVVLGPCGRELRVLASPGDESIGIDWEHVSVSLPNRCPNWPEMNFIKDLFWDAEETVMQLHPPKSRWISQHQFCLHMWRPTSVDIPLPPDITVGVKEDAA